MVEIPPLPELPAPEERPRWAAGLLATVAALEEVVTSNAQEILALRDQVARLRKHKTAEHRATAVLAGERRARRLGYEGVATLVDKRLDHGG